MVFYNDPNFILNQLSAVDFGGIEIDLLNEASVNGHLKHWIDSTHLGSGARTSNHLDIGWWLSRTWFTSDALIEEQTSAGAISSGWNLLVESHVNPAPTLEVFAQIRVLNEFGGFSVKGLKWMCVSCGSRAL